MKFEFFSIKRIQWLQSSVTGISVGYVVLCRVSVALFNVYSIFHVARLHNLNVDCISLLVFEISVDASFDSLENRFVFCSITME